MLIFISGMVGWQGVSGSLRTVVSEWGIPINDTCKLWTPVRDTPIAEGFDCPWAHREGAHRLVLALSPSGGHFTTGRTSVRDLWGTLSSAGQGH